MKDTRQIEETYIAKVKTLKEIKMPENYYSYILVNLKDLDKDNLLIEDKFILEALLKLKEENA